MENFEIVPYDIPKHGDEVQRLYDEYIASECCKRMGIRLEERHQFSHIEDVLTVDNVFDEKFTGYSFVVIDSSGKVKGAQLSYLIDKATFKKDFIDVNKDIVNEKQYPENILKYCQHRYEVSKCIYNLYDEYNFERAVYLESTVVDKDARGFGLNLQTTVALANFTNEVILVEGQLPINFYMKHPIHATIPIGQLTFHPGFTLVNRILSYDLYVVPIEIRLQRDIIISSKL
eukprot:TCONS_00008670-protein